MNECTLDTLEENRASAAGIGEMHIICMTKEALAKLIERCPYQCLPPVMSRGGQRAPSDEFETECTME